jgi:Domain of unknown function (DUF4124)
MTTTVMVSVIGLVIACGAADAAVYKSVDPEGNVVYTDDPKGHGEPIKLPPISTVPPPKYVTSPAEAISSGSESQAPFYEQLSIVTPTADETLRDNPGNVTVKVALQPALDKAAGHRLQYFLDGQPQGEPGTADKAVFPNVPRGTHTAEVAVVDAAGDELQRSSSVRFYLHRQSVNFPRGPAAPAPVPMR